MRSTSSCLLVVVRKQDRQDGPEVPKPPQGPASSDLTSSHSPHLPVGPEAGDPALNRGLLEPLQIPTIAHAVQEAWPAAVSGCSRLVGVQGTVKDSEPTPLLCSLSGAPNILPHGLCQDLCDSQAAMDFSLCFLDHGEPE